MAETALAQAKTGRRNQTRHSFVQQLETEHDLLPAGQPEIQSSPMARRWRLQLSDREPGCWNRAIL
jgi:hypothetical protein